MRPGLAAGPHPRLHALDGGWAFSPASAGLPPGHITAQLHFLACLLELAAGTRPDMVRAIHKVPAYVRDRLLPWLRALRAEVAARPEGGFFAMVLAITEARARAVEREFSWFMARLPGRAQSVGTKGQEGRHP